MSRDATTGSEALANGRPAPVLEARSVSFAYGRDLVLDHVDLQVMPGEFLALVGPNGSGKSTLLKVLMGLLNPLTGSVRLFGVDPGTLRERNRLGYVPQRPALAGDLPATVEEVVIMGRLASGPWYGRLRALDRRVTDEALSAVGLLQLRKRRVGELSVGQQQRVFIARALASRPELLVLDEPIAGVDAESQRRFRDSLTHMVREQHASVLLVSHELGLVADELDRIVVLKRRVIFDGPPEELAASGVSLGVHSEDLPLWLEGLR
ncbi:MAG: metal ABC transporter ATP-binding protein [Actinomycetota bacterium]